MDLSEILVDHSETLVDLSETLVGLCETLVASGSKNFEQIAQVDQRTSDI